MMEFLKSLDWSPLFISLKTGVAVTVISFFAGIYAAKEACLKALGCGMRFGTWQDLEVFHDDKLSNNDVQILGLTSGNKRTLKWIDKKYIEDNKILHSYKVLVPKSNGSGALGEVLSTPLIGEPLIGEPLIGFTQSFIAIGCFDKEEEAKNALKY
ncbi:MAG: 4'-phosphopantetheinyl transferase superfamily protein, partial [Erysipelotrichaceae bacterium]|nr:4'-phosphopantetheinyl transferase superfamily protein [Erysipelotrichaceae bacterium]